MSLVVTALLAVAPAALNATTVTATYQARYGTLGVGTVRLFSDGHGTVIVNLAQLRPGRVYDTSLAVGRCPSIGAATIALPRLTVSASGKLGRTLTLTAAQVAKIRAALIAGRLLLRVGALCRTVYDRIHETVVLIPAGDHSIPGVLALPRAGGVAGTYPAVVLLHGFASHKDEVGDMYRRLARALAERGYASLRIDFAGSGDSEQPFLDLTYPGMVGDARTALEWLIARPETIDDRVGVQGFSLGSMVGATVAGTDGRVKAFGSWSGAIYNGRQFPFAGQFLSACEANGGHLVLDLGFIQVDLSCAFFSTMQAVTALDDIAPYAEPILLVAGSIDTVVDPLTSQNVITVVDSLDATLRILPGADHIYLVLTPDQTLANECITLTADWYAEKL